jgi:hypothetical protein
LGIDDFPIQRHLDLPSLPMTLGDWSIDRLRSTYQRLLLAAQQSNAIDNDAAFQPR